MAAAVVERGTEYRRDVCRTAIRAEAMRRAVAERSDWHRRISPSSRLSCWNALACASMRKPVKVVSIMKLTTPPTASAPYTDEAPPVKTSTRLTSWVGMKSMSGYGLRLSPASGAAR